MPPKARKAQKRKNEESDDSDQGDEQPLQWHGGKSDGKKVMKLMKDIPRNELCDFEDDYTDTHEFVRECCMVSHANTKAIKEMTNRWHNHIKETFKLCPKASEEELKKYQNDLITEGNRILMVAMQSLKFGKAINKSMCDLGLHAKKVFYWTKNELDQEDKPGPSK